MTRTNNRRSEMVFIKVSLGASLVPDEYDLFGCLALADVEKLYDHLREISVGHLDLLVEDADHAADIHLVLYLCLLGRLGLRVQNVGDLTFEALLAVLDVLAHLADWSVVVPLELLGQLSTDVDFVLWSVQPLNVS